LAHKVQFFIASDWKWNVFDLTLVGLSVMDELMASQVNLSASRIIRVFRMARVLRIIRIVEAFRELREMLCTIIVSLRSVFWALVLLLLVMYLFAITFMQSAMNAIEHQGAPPAEFELNWGSLDAAMYSLIAAVSGGQDWVEIASPFDHSTRWYRVVFCLYIVLVVIGMLNILTGVFVSRAAEIVVLDKDLVIQAQSARQKCMVRDLNSIFQEIDQTQCGSVDIDHLTDYMARDDVRAYLDVQQLHFHNSTDVAAMLDPHKTGRVAREEFIAGCLRYKGNAQTLDVAMLASEQRRQTTKLDNLTKALQQHVQTISKTSAIQLSNASAKSTCQPMETSISYEIPAEAQSVTKNIMTEKGSRRQRTLLSM